MPRIKSALHHWWPQSVSEYWKDSGGCVTRLFPNGRSVPAPPKNWGAIQNGHIIKLSPESAESPWDESFEGQFHNADEKFPFLIDWLQGVFSEDLRHLSNHRDRFVAHPISDEYFRALIECTVSLAVRSPRTRDRAVAAAERLRGPLPEQERNSLIGLNLRHFHMNVIDRVRDQGKAAVLYSPEREFIFGDGFFHTLTSPPSPPHWPAIVAPVTPNMALLYTRPMRYRTEPRFFTMILSEDEVAALNHAVQVYSSQAIFFREQAPDLSKAFLQGRHLVYADDGHLIDQLLHGVPGVPPRNAALQQLLSGGDHV